LTTSVLAPQSGFDIWPLVTHYHCKQTTTSCISTLSPLRPLLCSQHLLSPPMPTGVWAVQALCSKVVSIPLFPQAASPAILISSWAAMDLQRTWTMLQPKLRPALHAPLTVISPTTGLRNYTMLLRMAPSLPSTSKGAQSTISKSIP